ncbi:MAG: hypothetical protein ACRDF0_04965 [Candidatus Limnocylindria bacterium]
MECRGCDLRQRGTQKVFGEGPRTARVLFDLRLVKPDVLVCLGATAAQALSGRAFTVTRAVRRLAAGRRA